MPADPRTSAAVHTGPDSPHVTGTPAEFWRGECELKDRENTWLWRALWIQPFVLLGLLWLVTHVG